MQLQNWMTQWVSSTWGIQTGPFASYKALFVLEIFDIFHSHTGSPILRAGSEWNELPMFLRLSYVT